MELRTNCVQTAYKLHEGSTALTSINKTFILTDIIYSSNDDLKFNPTEEMLGTNGSVETNCVYFQSLAAKGHENYVGVTCVNLLCVCSEMLCCVKANTPTTYTLLNNTLKDV
jgi:hypothetical protein